MQKIKWAKNEMPATDDQHFEAMSMENVENAYNFHKSFPQYSVTPLTELKKMSELLGLNSVMIKDESYRFGLNAFKVLGGSYAMARYIAKKLGRDVKTLPYETLTSPKLKEELGTATFYTATDGNHGRGVAWAANKLGQKSVVFMPKGSTKTRLENIRKENAVATIEEFNYDECVRMANDAAEKDSNGIMIQDTAWEGYEEVPTWIMQGYGTMAKEAADQAAELVEKPTHIVVQAGVGSLAGAVVGYFANRFKENPPKFIVVEASEADCLYRGAVKKDGSLAIVGGDMPTIMAGLACGEPNTISWDLLKNHVDVFVSAPDWVAELGMRMLAAPIKGDTPVTSGESGAVTFGLLAAIMQMDEYKDLREYLNLGADSKVLCFSTEGDTDPDRYKEIVWKGTNYGL